MSYFHVCYTYNFIIISLLFSRRNGLSRDSAPSTLVESCKINPPPAGIGSKSVLSHLVWNLWIRHERFFYINDMLRNIQVHLFVNVRFLGTMSCEFRRRLKLYLKKNVCSIKNTFESPIRNTRSVSAVYTYIGNVRDTYNC